MSDPTISARVPESLRERLAALAGDKPIGDVIREAVEKHLADPIALADHATENARLKNEIAVAKALSSRTLTFADDDARATIEAALGLSTELKDGALVFRADGAPVDEQSIRDTYPDLLLSRTGGGSGGGEPREVRIAIRPKEPESPIAKMVESQTEYNKLSPADRIKLQRDLAARGGVL